MSATVRATAEARAGSFFLGTIGFDLYLAALCVAPEALKAPGVPRSEKDLAAGRFCLQTYSGCRTLKT